MRGIYLDISWMGIGARKRRKKGFKTIYHYSVLA
jgi:hypothetical protein